MDAPPWYKNRSYLHFDDRLGITRVVSLVTDPHRVARHSFHPFIRYNIETTKIRKDPAGLILTPKPRPISYAAHVDSHIYAYYCQQLSERYEAALAEKGLGHVVLAFRKLGKSNIDFAADAFNAIKRMGPCSVIGLDITQFFDRLDHQLLKHRWCTLLDSATLPDDHYAVFKSLTRYAYVERDALLRMLGYSKYNLPTKLSRLCDTVTFRQQIRPSGLITTYTKTKGIPQGSPISAMLSNVYMLAFDEAVTAAVEEQGGVYFRYCDDMLLIVPSVWRDDTESFVGDEIAKLHLEINPKKTEKCNFRIEKGQLIADRPLQYLGFIFDGQQITLRSSGLARYSRRMRRGVRRAKRQKIKANRRLISRGKLPKALFRHKLYETYSHLGRRNFIRYGIRAADTLKSRAIKRQLKPLWSRLVAELEK